MDTIHISINCRAAVNQIRTAMLNLGALKKANPWASVFRESLHLETKTNFGLKRNVFLVYEPRNKYATYGILQLQLKEFDNFHDAESFIKNLLGEHQKSLSDFKINRIDCAVEIEMDIDTFKREVLVKSLRTTKATSSNSETLYFGSRKSGTEIKAYCKGDEEEIIRVEVSYQGTKVPIRTFGALKRLSEFNPFESVRFYTTDHQRIKSQPMEKQGSLVKFWERVEMNGLMAAKRDKNGYSKYRKFLSEIRTDFLSNAWRSKCRSFFEDDSLGDSPMNLKDLRDSERLSPYQGIACIFCPEVVRNEAQAVEEERLLSLGQSFHKKIHGPGFQRILEDVRNPNSKNY